MCMAGAVLIYTNIAAFLGHAYPKSLARWLPLPRELRDQFALYGVFHEYRTNGWELSLWGLPVAAHGDTNQWRKLDADELLPYRRPHQDQRIRAMRHRATAEPEVAEREARLVLGRKVRERHNRLHPESPIERVGLREEEWPLQASDFLAGRGNPGNRVRFVVITPESTR